MGSGVIHWLMPSSLFLVKLRETEDLKNEEWS